MVTNQLYDLLSNENKTILKPKEFFIADCGVPVLFFQGFSNSLITIMQKVQTKVPGLKRINPVEKWPKVTLGTLRDDRTLSLNDAKALLEVCENLKIPEESVEIKVNKLVVVLFGCRSLELRLHSGKIELRDPRDNTVDAASAETVKELLQRFSSEKLREYWDKYLLKEGERESYYRRYHIESTLIVELPQEDNLNSLIEEFQKQVNCKVPNAYEWFAPQSRHLTLLPLVPVEKEK